MSILFWKALGTENKVFVNNAAYCNACSLTVIKMDEASPWLSERVGVHLAIFPSEFFTKKEQLPGPLLSLFLL